MRRLALLVLLLLTVSVPVPSRQSNDAPTQQPAASTKFHHVHLNSTDPAKAIDFYTSTFDVAKKSPLAGFDAVQSEQIYLLFDRVNKPPATAPDSAIWHFGWGSIAMEDDYRKHLGNGVTFHTPITRLGSGLQFAYMKAPDGALVEINSSNTRAFIHVHLYSDAPLCAAEWYVKNLGATTRSTRTDPCVVPFAAPSEPLGVIRSPAATVRFGEISLIIYPRQHPGPLVSPRGHTVDHIALSVPNLADSLARLRNSGVRVLDEPRRFGNGPSQAALIEGPDSIVIELVETK